MSDARRLVGIDIGDDGKADVAEIVEDGRLVRHRLKVSVKPVHDFFARRPPCHVVATDGKGAWWLGSALRQIGHEVLVVSRAQPEVLSELATSPGSRTCEVLACLLRDAPSALRAVEPASPASALQSAVTSLCDDLARTVRARLAAEGVAVPEGSAAELAAAWPDLDVPDGLRAELDKGVATIAELSASADAVNHRLRLLRES